MNVIPIIDQRLNQYRLHLTALQNRFHQLSGAISVLEELKTQLEQQQEKGNNNEHSIHTPGSPDRTADVRPGIESESSRDR